MSRSYLEHYLNGAGAAVWAELTALGPLVRQEPLYSDARAVAHETMRRARENIQLIIERLRVLGYRFTDPEECYSPPPPDIQARLDAAEQEYGPLPISIRAWYEIVGDVCLLGAHPRLSVYLDHGWENPDDAPFADPLFVGPFDPIDYYSRTLNEELQQQVGRFASLWIMPDSCFKMNTSGGRPTQIIFPNAAMDAPFLSEDWPGMLFVNYLRLSFDWGGFAGFAFMPEQAAAAREELAYLTEGLLPI